MSNSISFVGRVGSDPERKDAGVSNVLNFRVANDTGYGDKKTTNWFRCGYWGRRGVKLANYLEKGKQVFISGELTIREYEKDGQKRISPEINVEKVDFVGSREPSEPRAAPQTEGEDLDMPF